MSIDLLGIFGAAAGGGFGISGVSLLFLTFGIGVPATHGGGGRSRGGAAGPLDVAYPPGPVLSPDTPEGGRSFALYGSAPL